MSKPYHPQTPETAGFNRKHEDPPRPKTRGGRDFENDDRRRCVRADLHPRYSLMSKSTMRLGALFFAESTACITNR